MSRVDDRIRARLQMQIVLRGIAVSVALCLLWLVGPIVEATARGQYRANHSGPSLGIALKNTSGVLSLGLCLAIPGLLLLPAAGWLSGKWGPLKSLGLCPDCGERLFTPGANRESNAHRVSGWKI